MWIFGYGSLIWKPNIPFDERAQGYVEGWTRRFYQGSRDHRGVPGAPGRVVTMLPESGTRTHGVAFHVPQREREMVLERLDVREQGGYVRQDLLMTREDNGHDIKVLVYCALPDNPDYLGPAPLPEMAAQIARSSGPSGPNDEYVLELERVLRDMRVEDPHTFALAKHLRDVIAVRGASSGR